MPITLETGDLLTLESGDSLLLESDSTVVVVTPPPSGGPAKIPQPHWKFVLSDPPPTGVEQRELATAYGRRLTLRLDGVHDAQFSLDGKSDEATEINELATDLVIYRTNSAGVTKKMHRGRIKTETDEIFPDNHSCQFSTNDYRGMMEVRFVGIAGKDFSVTDVGTIAFTLISDSQALAGGNWGITNGIGAVASITHTVHYDPGYNVSQALENLSHRATGGFEWEIDPNLALNRWYPERGSATGAVLDFGGVIANVRKQLSSAGFGNVAITTGDGNTTTAVSVASPTVGTDPQGRWEQYQSFSDVSVQSTLVSKANWLLGITKTLRPQYAVELIPGRWDTDTMWLGDTVFFVCRDGRTNIAAFHRIVEINISIDTDGIETVKLGLVLA